VDEPASNSLKISEPQLERAVVEVGLSPDQSRAIWLRLQAKAEVEAHFEPAHVGYYFGALLLIGAMGWFITEGWDRFTGWQLATIAAGYATVFLLVGRRLWPKPLFRIPGGLLVTVAVCMTPLAVYGIERQLNVWPASNPGSYTHFHPLIHASWVGMEISTVVTAMIALRYFKFPFLTAPAAYALWYMSMDATALIFGREWQWRDMCMISAMFGAIMLLVSYWLDGKTTVDFSFWGYLFGLLTFTCGLSAMDSGSQLAKFGYFLAHLALIVVSLLLRRKVFLVFGAIGVFGYLSNEAYTYFRDSVAFPFVLSLIGIALIFGAMQYKKNEAMLQQRIRALLSRDIGRLGN
jgi:uncharacterized membrane protein YiaA